MRSRRARYREGIAWTDGRLGVDAVQRLGRQREACSGVGHDVLDSEQELFLNFEKPIPPNTVEVSEYLHID